PRHVQPFGPVIQAEGHQVADLLARHVGHRHELAGPRLDRRSVRGLHQHLPGRLILRHGNRLRTVSPSGVIRRPLTGLRSIGHEDRAPTRFWSVRNTMWSPVRDTDGLNASVPAAWGGVFWKMLMGAGIRQGSMP